LRAAAGQFARKSYSGVSLDDILADAKATKGAMYFHFRSKRALASDIVEYGAIMGRDAFERLLAQRLSGLESLVDISFLIAVNDIGDETARAGLNLLESLSGIDDLPAKVLANWVESFAKIVRRAVDEGDVVSECDPDSIARLLVSMYLGLRQTSNLADPERLLRDLQNMWTLVLPGFAARDQSGYLTEFVRRRATVALRRAKPFSPDGL
jgi:AcrR family transcriptional regulator